VQEKVKVEMPTVERGHSFCFALIAFGRATEIK